MFPKIFSVENDEIDTCQKINVTKKNKTEPGPFLAEKFFCNRKNIIDRNKPFWT